MATESLALGVLLGAAGVALVAYALHRLKTFPRRRVLLAVAMAASLASVGVRLLARSSVVPSFALATVALYLLVRAWNGDESAARTESDESAVDVDTDAPARDAPTVGRADADLGGVHAPDYLESKRVRVAVVALAAISAAAVAVALADALTARAAITVVVAVPLGRLFGYVANRAVTGRDGRKERGG